jgi:hypothetical protein
MCLQYADSSAVAVDATCGNGSDTLWLARHFAKVYAFDIQQAAIEATAARLEREQVTNVRLICDGHQNMVQYVKEPPKVIVFNLGYLPGAEKEVTTKPVTTMAAIRAALEILAVDGLLCVTMYQGHSQGYEERLQILEWAKGLDKRLYHCVRTDMVNQPALPPEILWITKKKGI